MTRRPRVSVALLGQLAVVALLTALVGASFAGAFETGYLVPMVTAAAVFAVAVPAAVHLAGPRRFAAFAPLASAVGFVVFAMVVATRSPAPSLLADGLVNGWKRVLTDAPPVDVVGSNLVLPLLTVWIAGLASTELVLRARTVVWALVPAVVGMSFGAAMGAGDPVDNFGRAPMVLALAGAFGLLLLASVADAGVRSARLRMLSWGVPVVVVAALAGTIIGPKLPLAGARPPLELRDHVDEKPRPTPLTNPVALLAAAERDTAQAAVSGHPLPTVFTVDATAPVERYRLAVLDTYDGVQWSSGATFAPAGHNLPPADPTAPVAAAPGTQPVSQTITVGDVPGGFWLPAADRPVRVSRGGLLFDRTTGVLATAGATHNLTYSVDSEVPSYDLAALQGAQIAEGDAAAAYLAVPSGVPDALRTLATRAMTASTFQLQQVYDLQEYLKANRQLLPANQARPGHTLEQLDRFLTDPAAKQGSPEQFAASFALLARLADIPSRLVVGYKGAGEPGRQTVTAADMTVWPEVLFADLGWVPFDPTPTGASDPAVAPADVAKASTGQAIEQAAAPGDDSAADAPDERGGDVAGTTLEVAARVSATGVAIVVGLVVALALLTSIGRRRRTRARRQAPQPRDRIVGAWEETVDLLAESRSVGALTAAEVVVATTAIVGPDAEPALAQLAVLVNTARYAATEPTDEDAVSAWTRADEVHVRWARTRTVREKLRHRLDPRARRGALRAPRPR